MSDKTRQEFEEWALPTFSLDRLRSDKTQYDSIGTQRAWVAWQHQQAIIDARDAKMHAVFAELDAQPFGQLQLQEEHHLQANALFKIRKILEGRS